MPTRAGEVKAPVTEPLRGGWPRRHRKHAASSLSPGDFDLLPSRAKVLLLEVSVTASEMRFPNLRIHLILAPSYLPSRAAISASAKILHKTKKRPRPPRAAREGARCRLTAPTREARGGHAEGAPRAAAWATASVGGQASRRHGDTARVSAGANAASGSAGHRMLVCP